MTRRDSPKLRSSNLDTWYVKNSIKSFIVARAPLLSGTLLDIGCGRMPYKELVLAASPNIVGYIGLDLEHNQYMTNGLDLRWDGETIPLPSESVDCALLTEVLEHCPAPERTLGEAFRVLKHGGVLLMTVPFVWPLHDMPSDYQRLAPAAIGKLAADCGFSRCELTGLGDWDAVLGVTAGLWVRRRPMSDLARSVISWAMYLPIRALLSRARDTEVFEEQSMFVGLGGRLTK